MKPTVAKEATAQPEDRKMKVTKKGILKLDANDTRVGNFVFTNEEEHIKVQDINTVYWLRISKRMPLGIWLNNIIRTGEAGYDTLKTWVATVWSVLSVAPDDGFIHDLLKASDSALNRHPDWYGIDRSQSEEDDRNAAEEVKGMMEFEEEVKNLSEKKDTGSE